MKKVYLIIILTLLIGIFGITNYGIWYVTSGKLMGDNEIISFDVNCMFSEFNISLINKTSVKINQDHNYGIVYIESFNNIRSEPIFYPIQNKEEYIIYINQNLTKVVFAQYSEENNEIKICSQSKVLEIQKPSLKPLLTSIY